MGKVWENVVVVVLLEKKRREPIVNKHGFACPSFPQPRKNGMNHVISMFFAVAFFFVP